MQQQMKCFVVQTHPDNEALFQSGEVDFFSKLNQIPSISDLDGVKVETATGLATKEELQLSKCYKALMQEIVLTTPDNRDFVLLVDDSMQLHPDWQEKAIKLISLFYHSEYVHLIMLSHQQHNQFTNLDINQQAGLVASSDEYLIPIDEDMSLVPLLEFDSRAGSGCYLVRVAALKNFLNSPLCLAGDFTQSLNIYNIFMSNYPLAIKNPKAKPYANKNISLPFKVVAHEDILCELISRNVKLDLEILKYS